MVSFLVLKLGGQWTETPCILAQPKHLDLDLICSLKSFSTWAGILPLLRRSGWEVWPTSLLGGSQRQQSKLTILYQSIDLLNRFLSSLTSPSWWEFACGTSNIPPNMSMWWIWRFWQRIRCPVSGQGWLHMESEMQGGQLFINLYHKRRRGYDILFLPDWPHGSNG